MVFRRAAWSVVGLVFVLEGLAFAQIPGQNVNMVAGTTWPGGDPFLQRQNEPPITVSTRNPLHLVAGANDYRTVDLPGLPSGGATGDAWNGIFFSINGGGNWFSTLIPGYPQDNSPEGLASPLKGYQAGADPIVRAGTHGLIYYGGLVFNRGENQPSAIFMSRWVDRNNKENGNPFAYIATSIVAKNSGLEFLDKPTFAVGLPGPVSAICKVDGKRIVTGPVYAAWTVFFDTEEVSSQIVLSRSLDCGRSWSAPRAVSQVRTNQSASIVIDPRNGHLYVSWRQFASNEFPNAIMIAKSTNGGLSFSPPATLQGFFSFDQGTTNTSFRTNSYPTMAIDGTGRIYAAWTARGFAPAAPDPSTGDARVVISTSTDGVNWSMPRAVDNFPGRGHQIMPAITYGAGKLQLVYYDLREDISGFFEQFIDEFSILLLPPGTPGKKRHTLDVRTAQAAQGPNPQFASYAVTPVDPSFQASRYLFGSRPGSSIIEQLQFNPPNLPLYAMGSVPFIGDYIDVAAQQFMSDRQADGSEVWRYTRPGDNPIFHLVWTDNRDVRPPPDGDWTNYTPPLVSGSGGPSIFDPSQNVPPCVPGRAGMRNSNIYTSRVSPGLVAGSPGNDKPLNTQFARAFVVFAQNTTADLALYEFSIRNQPPGGQASFQQFAFLPAVQVLVPGGSSAARTVFITSTDPSAAVFVDIVQIAGGGATPPPPEGRSATVVLNPDISNPDISNPDISNPDISNPDISNAEVYNPDISNPDISNPDISNPDISNPDISNPDISNVNVANPDISNPDISNPDISNPDISNPDISNPDISNPDISNGTITDYSYETTNNGNTAAQYDLELLVNNAVPNGIKLQLVIHRVYQTPVADGCNLMLQSQNQVLMNLPNPLDFDAPITFWLEPGEIIKLTVRVFDTDGPGGAAWDPTESLTLEVRAAAVNTEDAANGVTEPPSASVTPPVAHNDAYDAVAAAVLDVPAPGVMANDMIAATLNVVPTLVDGPAHAASFTLRMDGGFLYVPEPGFAGVDTFTYFLSDGLRSNVATVSITVSGEVVVVSNTNGDGPGSFVAALQHVNAHPNGSSRKRDTIEFNIPGPGPHRIFVTSLLPVIAEPVMIDARTQPGWSGRPLVILDGSNADFGDIEGAYGLAITAGRSEIRGLAVVNMPGKGVVLSSSGGNLIADNWIGIDPFPAAGADSPAAPNVEAGLAILQGSSGNQVLNNVLSGNDGAGVNISFSNSNFLRGNLIGTDGTGTQAVPNTEGVSLRDGIGNRIGGTAEGDGNVIAGNDDLGIFVWMTEVNPANTVIAGNRIGVGADDSALGNGGDGIVISVASGVTVGGADPAAANAIAHNGGRGVNIQNGVANPVSRNRIHSNTLLGIDLGGDGATPNDPLDADAGANNLQNFPVLTEASPDFEGPGTVRVTGTINTTPNTAVRIEFFSAPTCDTAASEAHQFIGFTDVVTNGAGNASFDVEMVAAVDDGTGITSTATAGNSTSELSACVSVGFNH